jgi:hypothetical protein
MAQMVNTWLVHGAVERSVWCEVHNLPHILRYKLYSFSEPAPGFLSLRLVKEVEQCDSR